LQPGTILTPHPFDFTPMKLFSLVTLGLVAFQVLSFPALASQQYSPSDLSFLRQVEQNAYEAGLEIERYSYLIPAAQQKTIARKVCRVSSAATRRQPLKAVIAQAVPEIFVNLKAEERGTLIQFTEIVARAGVHAYCPLNRSKFF